MRHPLKIILPSLFLLFALVISGCNSDEDEPEPTPPPMLSLVFSHQYNNEAFELNKIYLTSNQDSILISEHKYMVSNIVLRNTIENKEVLLQNTYYLVKVPIDSNVYELEIDGAEIHIPTGTWNQMDFLIGLDSAMNFAPEGAPKLFSDEGMFWDWSTGYKFYVSEGKYFSKDLAFPNVGTIVHIGDMVNLVKVSFDLGPEGNLILISGKNSRVDIKVNVDELYFNPNLIDLSISNYQQAIGGPQAIDYRENYSNNYWTLKNVTNP